jgi:hypothetical protein
MEEREPDLSEDPRGQETGAGGYPESAPAGQDPGQGAGDRGPSPDAPSTSAPEEGDPGQATGNPDAAG